MALTTIQNKRGTTAGRPALLDGEFYINKETRSLEMKIDGDLVVLSSLGPQPQVEIFGAGAGTFDIPAGYFLEKMVFAPETDAAAVKAGYSAGGDELLMETPISEAQGLALIVNLYSKTGTTLHFTGLTANMRIVFFLQLINLV